MERFLPPGFHQERDLWLLCTFATSAFTTSWASIHSYGCWIIIGFLQACCVEYIILEGDNLSSLFPNAHLNIGAYELDSHHIFALATTLAVLPTVWLRDLSILSYLSGESIAYPPKGESFWVSFDMIKIDMLVHQQQWLYSLSFFNFCSWRCPRINLGRRLPVLGWHSGWSQRPCSRNSYQPFQSSCCYRSLRLLLLWACRFPQYILIDAKAQRIPCCPPNEVNLLNYVTILWTNFE